MITQIYRTMNTLIERRKSAMAWWNSLTSPYRTQMCDTHGNLLTGVVRRWETLTGREIQMIFECDCDCCKVLIKKPETNI